MKILALITARGGSKRVPGKNVRPLAGRPLIAWTIETAKKVGKICAVVVSTDDPEIAEVSRAAGATVPWLRPAELATDTTPSAAVCRHALDWYEQTYGAVDGIALLQPTSPFRTTTTVKRGIALYAANSRRTVVAVSPAHSHPLWCYRIDGTVMRPFIDSDGPPLRSQDLPPAYAVNGAFYLISGEDLRNRGSFLHDATQPLVMDQPLECIDIDTEWDWAVAEALTGRADANR